MTGHKVTITFHLIEQGDSLVTKLMKQHTATHSKIKHQIDEIGSIIANLAH